MRILMISDVYFPRINGVSTSIQTFKGEFEKLGHEVTLIAPDYPTQYAADDTVVRIPSRGIPFDPEDRMMRLRDIVRLHPALAGQGFDLIHVHTPFVAHYAGVKLARLLNLPLVLTYHTLFEEYLYHYIPFLPKMFLKKIARHCSRTQCNQADSIIAPSSAIVELLQRYGVSQSIEVIPTGIHCDRFQHGDGQRFRDKLGLGPERKVLLNVSRVAFEKNIGLLLEVVNQLRSSVPEVCLVIAGEGPAKKSYQQQVKTMALEQHVLFVGYLDRATELMDCYHSADLFVFSSRTETQGLVLLEAMAAGVPVVSVAAMGTRDILLDCAAAQIVGDNVAHFSHTLIQLLGDDEARRRLASAAGDSAARWDSEVMARRMLHHYRDTLQEAVDGNDLASAKRPT
ncbi:MAG: glycosyltransferase family 4 protein [Pseudohongiellaceae bacterium]